MPTLSYIPSIPGTICAVPTVKFYFAPVIKLVAFYSFNAKKQLMDSSGGPFHPALPVNFIKDSEYPQTNKWGKGTSVIGNMIFRQCHKTSRK